MNQYKISLEEVAALTNIQNKLHGQARIMGWHNKEREVGTLIYKIAWLQVAKVSK